MKIIYNIIQSKNLYIFLTILSLNIFFFSTAKVEAKVFEIDNIEISKPFEMKFDKNSVINEGFKKSFSELVLVILNSTDQKKIKQIKLNEIKAMIETFSIKEEKFIDEFYYVKLGVSFDKKKVFNFLEKKNIFPSIPNNNKFLFLPIIIDEKKKDLLIFSKNKIFEKWNDDKKSYELIDYILPTEDLEDLRQIESKYENIEKYDFKEITDKYFLKDSIIALIFKNENKIRILSRINIKDNVSLKNQSYDKFDLNEEDQIQNLIDKLKIIYEDHWKNTNKINTSIKLSLSIMVDSTKDNKIKNFEKILEETDLIYDFKISKFDKNHIFYQIIFNGTPDIFIKKMSENYLDFNTQNKIWILK